MHVLFRRMAIGSAVSAIAIASPVLAQTASFNVPSQSVASAVRQFARQARIQIIVSGRIAEGRRTQPVQGVMSIDQALERMLADTGLATRMTGAGTYVIIKNIPQTSDSGVGDIVVTATRSETRASKTPVTLTAVKGDTLLAQGIANPLNLAEQIPSLFINRAGTNNVGMQITIRGVTSTDTTDKGDPSAAFMVNGTYLARPQAQEVSFFDIDRIEVLRGPQGTLFGRNTTAGLINIILNKPEPGKIGGTLAAAYGNDDTRQITAVANLPIGQNIAIRAAGNYDYRDSYMNMGPRFATPVDPFKNNLSGRLSALADLGRGQLLIIGDYSSLKGSIINQLPVSNFYSNYQVKGGTPIYTGSGKSAEQLLTQNANNNNPTFADSHTWGMSADFRYDLGLVTVNYLGSYRELSRKEYGLAIPDSGASPIPIRFFGDYWQNSQELRFSTNGDGPFKAQAGAYYFKEHSHTLNYYQGYSSNTPGVYGYFYGFPQNPTVAESWALFGQATYKITDRLRTTGGIRYSSDLKWRNGFTETCGTIACDQPTDSISPNIEYHRWSQTTWRAGLDYDINSRALLYGTASTGYKAGSFNDGCVIGTVVGCKLTEAGLYVRPEHLTAYEIGLKTRFAADVVRLNIAAFHYDYKDMQLSALVNACGGPCTVVTNAARSRIDGLEMEGTITPARTDRFDASLSLLNARYTDFTPSTGANWAGRKLDRAPNIALTAGYTHSVFLANGGKVQAGVRTNLSDSYYLAALGTLNQFRVPGYTKTDLLLTYNAPKDMWYVQGYVKNIENHIVVSSVSTGQFAYINYQDPRTYGIRAGMKL